MICTKVMLTKKEAIAAGKNFGKQRQYRREKRYYHCPICNGWHLTSMEDYSDTPEPTKLFFPKVWKTLIKEQKRINRRMEKLERLKEEHERLRKIVKEKQENMPLGLNYEMYVLHLEPEVSDMDDIDRKIRMLEIPTYSDLPSYGQVMPLSDFKECCLTGGFIDYDGSGNYVKDGKMSNISIYPSDIKAEMIRFDFDTIIWFNR